jgi:hypothetical protein
MEKQENPQSNKAIEGAMISANTFAINIQWYTQKVIGILKYIVEGGDNVVPFVNSNSNLLLIVLGEHITQVPRRQNVPSTIEWMSLSIVKETTYKQQLKVIGILEESFGGDHVAVAAMEENWQRNDKINSKVPSL